MNRAQKLTNLCEGKAYDKFRRTNGFPQGSKWDRVAAKFDVGVLDLDNIAVEAGFDGFEDLDRHFPKDFDSIPVFPELCDGFKKFAASAGDMSMSKIEDIILKG